MIEFATAPIQKIEDSLLSESGVELYVKRLDLVDEIVSGNKPYKLKYNIDAVLQGVTENQRHDVKVASFGGAYSNHIHALAAMGQRLGIQTLGFIRGDDPRLADGKQEKNNELTPTLQDAVSWGMELVFLSRTEYRNRQDSQWLAELSSRYGPFFLIPEGGSNELGARGCGDIITEIENQLEGRFDTIFTACGTGATLAGMSMQLGENKNIIGIPVLKGADFLTRDIQSLQSEMGGVKDNWQLVHDFHGGGYAKFDAALVRFIDVFYERTGIPLEPIYTGKLFSAVWQMVADKRVERGSRVVVVHSGGLQGLRGVERKMQRYREAATS